MWFRRKKQEETPSQGMAKEFERPEKTKGLFSKLSRGLTKSSGKLSEQLTSVFVKAKLDDESLDDLEDILLTSDMGARAAEKIRDRLSKQRFDKTGDAGQMKIALAEAVADILKPCERPMDLSNSGGPQILLFVGVNGAGKTTTIGKIASKLRLQGAKSLLVAGDTFRAAAVDQLKIWGDRVDVPVMAGEHGADAASLAYEAVKRAQDQGLDCVLIDTAGRLQNKTELMSELAKILRVIRKLDPDAPHHILLVLDATVGQNAISQAEAFRHSAEVTGLIMTKLDGTAKGGVLVALAETHGLPVHFVGMGETAEDLHPFEATPFANALVGTEL